MLRLLGLVIAIASVSPRLHANGRPPLTNGIFFQRNDPHALYVRTTFGLLVSHDDGCSFRWTCEQNIGYGGMFDPSYAIGDDGTLYAATFTGLRVSRDGGCSFTTATAQLPATDPGRISDMYVDGIDLGPTGDVWVVTADTTRTNDVFQSTDGGTTFAPRGLAPLAATWTSVKVAPSDPQRVYVSGYRLVPPTDASSAPVAHVMVTTDGGQMWNEASLAGVQLAATPLVAIAAVDPADPQRVYLISVGASGAGDRLYRSLDGGMAFTEVLSTGQPIANVVIRDASTAIVATGVGGGYVSSDGGGSFAPLAGAPQLSCLGKRSDGSLVGCGTNWDPDFMAVAGSSDAQHWQKIFRFIELDGPLACAPGTVAHDVCDQQLWPTLRQQFGATGPMCATAIDLPGTEVDGIPPPRPPGCCSVGGGSAIDSFFLGLVTAWLVWRRPRRSTKIVV